MASARQRAGRAGRTRPGECWRLSGESFWGGDTLASNNAETVTHEPHAGSAIVSGMARLNLDSNRAAERTAPDILRMPLEDVVLRVLQLNLGNPEIFLSTCIDAPEVQSTR